MPERTIKKRKQRGCFLFFYSEQPFKTGLFQLKAGKAGNLISLVCTAKALKSMVLGRGTVFVLSVTGECKRENIALTGAG